MIFILKKSGFACLLLMKSNGNQICRLVQYHFGQLKATYLVVFSVDI